MTQKRYINWYFGLDKHDIVFRKRQTFAHAYDFAQATYISMVKHAGHPGSQAQGHKVNAEVVRKLFDPRNKSAKYKHYWPTGREVNTLAKIKPQKRLDL